MNVLFLGNGFDLAHKLPTKYINFLNTVDSLSKRDITKIKTLGDVFSNVELNKKDKEIRESYEEYRDLYDSTPIDATPLSALHKLTINNLWYKYLAKSLNADVNWIDFEKEIGIIIQSFQNIFSQCSNEIVHYGKLDQTSKYIITEFGFFLDPINLMVHNRSQRIINQKYLLEEPVGSNNRIIDKDKIVNELSEQLSILADGLRLYLKCFVDNMIDRVSNTQRFPWKQAFKYSDHIITFNYTNTYEKIYKSSNVWHIHGNIDGKIVMGINPDVSDSIESVDTTFIGFKKYFQRIKYRTDLDYLELVQKHNNAQNFVLYVIGHSLDTTDKDIIEEIFAASTQIYILNYNEQDESKHISNLISIFGKLEFDKIRREKNVYFLPIDYDLKGVMRENSQTEQINKWAQALSPF